MNETIMYIKYKIMINNISKINELIKRNLKAIEKFEKDYNKLSRKIIIKDRDDESFHLNVNFDIHEFEGFEEKIKAIEGVEDVVSFDTRKYSCIVFFGISFNLELIKTRVTKVLTD